MADKYLKESSSVDGYQLEDGSGVYLLEAPPTVSLSGVSLASGLVAAATVLSLMFAGPAAAGGRGVSTGITLVNYSTPAKATARVSSGFLEGKVALTGISRSHGQGIGELGEAVTSFDMGTGLSCASGSAQANHIRLLNSVMPSRAQPRLSEASLNSALPVAGFSRSHGLVQSASISTNFTLGPAIASGSARLSSGQLNSAIPLAGFSRASGLAPQANLSHASGPAADLAGLSRSHGRAQITGIQLYSYVMPARGIGRLTGVLGTAGAPTISFEGTARNPTRLQGNLVTYYCVTPSRSLGRLSSRIQLVYDVSPVRGSGLVRPASISVIKINSQGVSRQSSRLPGAQLLSQTAPAGLSRTSSRLTGQAFNSRILIAGVSRSIPRIYCASLEFLPISKIQLAGVSRSSERLQATAPNVYFAAQPSRSIGFAQPARLDSLMPLTGLDRASSRAWAALTFTGPLTIGIDGMSRGQSRLTASIHTYHAAGAIRSNGLIREARFVSSLPLQGISRNASRAVAILAFTGGTTASLTGRSYETIRALAELHAAWAAQPSRSSSRLTAQIQTKTLLEGIIRSDAVATGFFANPYELAISRAEGLVLPAMFTSALVLQSGSILDVAYTQAQLTIPIEHPKYIFLAKSRAFKFDAQGRRFVILAKSRKFVFLA